MQGLDNIKTTQGFRRLEMEVSPGDKVVPPTNSDDRIGYYILSGSNANKLKETIEDLNLKVHVIVKSDSRV